MKYKLQLTKKQLELTQSLLHAAWLDTLVEEGEWRDTDTATQSRILKNILDKIDEVI